MGDYQKLYELTNKMLSIQAFITLVLIILGIGITLNFVVITQNGGKMPVKTNYYFETSQHKSFNADETINHSKLADRYKIGRLIFSLGDFVMIFSFLLLVSLIVLQIKYNFRLKRLKNGF